MVIKICTGSSCHLNGSYDVIQVFKDLLKKYDVEDLIELKLSFCFGECINGVNVKCETGTMVKDESPMMTVCDDGFLLHHVDKDNAEDLFVQQIYPLLKLK